MTASVDRPFKSVYLAGSALDMGRAAGWHRRLTDAGIVVVSTWIENVSTVGSSNPRGAPRGNRFRWARGCLAEIERAEIFWMLVPDGDRPTRGAWAELGFAYGLARMLVSSGDITSSIFCSIGWEFESDQEAFQFVVAAAEDGPR
jgi:hypothetical protein